MPTLQTSTLAGAALDWAVAMAEGHNMPRSVEDIGGIFSGDLAARRDSYLTADWPKGARIPSYSDDPAQMQPIIEREHISTNWLDTHWQANVGFDPESGESAADEAGPTHLIAAARCWVSHKLGPTVDVPYELVEG